MSKIMRSAVALLLVLVCANTNYVGELIGIRRVPPGEQFLYLFRRELRLP